MSDVRDMEDLRGTADDGMRDAESPVLPRPRMPLSQRAKIFIPFDPLHGFQAALRQKEREAEASHRDRFRFEDAP